VAIITYVQLFGGTAPLILGSAKTSKNVRFWTTFDFDCHYLMNRYIKN